MKKKKEEKQFIATQELKSDEQDILNDIIFMVKEAQKPVKLRYPYHFMFNGDLYIVRDKKVQPEKVNKDERK